VTLLDWHMSAAGNLLESIPSSIGHLVNLEVSFPLLHMVLLMHEKYSLARHGTLS
jgi:hypothetical protein